MDWKVAIALSEKGTATRKQKVENRDETFIRYKDGSGFKIVAVNGKVDFELSRTVGFKEVDGYDDWQPSK
jgi:hypothetical protein